MSVGLARRADGGAIAFEALGNGPALLLVRPLGGTMALWGPFRERLAADFRVISFDLRGTGGSSGATAALSTTTLARDGLAVLDQMGLGRAHVFGLSLGGMVATKLAALAPERVDRLCIACAPIRGLELTRGDIGRELSLAATMLKSREKVEVSLVRRVLSEEFRRRAPARVREIETLVARQPSSRRALVRLAMAAIRHDARDDVGRVTAATLVLAGAYDRLAGHDGPMALARRLDAEFEIVPEAAHDVSLEQPERTAALVRRFMVHDASRPWQQ